MRIRIDRRGFVAASVAAAAGCQARRSPWRFLNVVEAQTLNAICDRIVPPDSTPGAAQAGVIRYIDRQLTRRFREFQETYRQGIAAADRLAGGAFGAIAPAQQDEILRKLENEQKAFFNLVVAHTMQGFYGSPRHGGNEKYVSWAMLGIPASPVRGRGGAA
jgi:gluconate 2-dehydrogenase gamma chain